MSEMRLIGYVVMKMAYDGALGRDRSLELAAERISGLGGGSDLRFNPYIVNAAATDSDDFDEILYQDLIVEVRSGLKASGPVIMMRDAYNMLNTLKVEREGYGTGTAETLFAMSFQLIYSATL